MTRLLFVFSLLFFTTVVHSQSHPLYVGSYTDGKSEGIYQFIFNSETGSLKDKKLVAKSNNPSYLVVSPNKDYVYAVSELDKYNNTPSGAVSAYKVNKDRTLERITELSSEGKHPCHLALNEKGNKLVVSTYTGGTFSLFDVLETGEIKPAKQIVNLNKDSIAAHTHSAQFYKDELFVADLGINTLEHFTLKDTLYAPVRSIAMKPKSGPRHFAMTKSRDYIYVINEYASTVSTLKKEGNSYVNIGAISTLKDSAMVKNSCADIHLSANEDFLYGSNRGENTIVVFKRNKKDGALEKIQSISCHGNWPRNFTIGPAGNFLLVANQWSNNIAVYMIDKKTGKLTFIYDIASDNPTCLQF